MMFNFDLEDDNEDVMIAMYSIILHQPPSVIRRETLADLQMCSIIKEVEHKKMEEEIKKSKRKGSRSVVPNGAKMKR
jgi:hypothetical protein